MILLNSILAAFAVSLLSLIGAGLLIFGKNKLEKTLFFLVSFSAGSLLGGAFFHLLTESLENSSSFTVFKYTFIGFSIFFILEKILHWHHCHRGFEENCGDRKILGLQNLIGDGVHNFIDGLIIVSAFAVNPGLGVAVTISVALHELPQELSDFGVLLYSGFSRRKALIYNLLSALFAVLGVLIGYFFIRQSQELTLFLIPFAAGGFIYIAASDLIPEINKEKSFRRSFLSFAFFLLAVLMMIALRH
jgi:zinc and cadmium transporter